MPATCKAKNMQYRFRYNICLHVYAQFLMNFVALASSTHGICLRFCRNKHKFDFLIIDANHPPGLFFDLLIKFC